MIWKLDFSYKWKAPPILNKSESIDFGRILLFVLLLFVLNKGKTVPTLDSLQLDARYQAIEQLMNEQFDWEKSLEQAQKILVQLPKDISPANKAKWVSLVGDCFLEIGKHKQALNAYLSALQLQRKNGQDFFYADGLEKLGNLFLEIKDYGRSKPYLDSALTLKKRIFEERDLEMARIYNNLGRYFNGVGDQSKAMEFHELALSIRLEDLTAPSIEVARSYLNVAQTRASMGKYVIAIDELKEGLRLLEESTSRHSTLFGDFYYNLGDAYYSLAELYLKQQNGLESAANFRVALPYFNEAVKVYEHHLNKGHPNLALCYNSLGNIYARLNQYDHQAINFHKQALAIRIDQYGEMHPDVAETYYNMGVGFVTIEAYQEAIPYYQASLASLGYDLKDPTNFDRVTNHSVLLNGLNSLGNIKAFANESNQSIEGLKESLDHFLSLDALIDFLRNRYESIGAKLLLAEQTHQIYNTAIFIAYQLYQATQEKGYQYLAFRFSEKSKSFLLLQSLKENRVESFANIDQSVIEEIRALELDISQTEKGIYQSSYDAQSFENGYLDSLKNMVFHKKQELSGALERLKSKYARYYDLIYATQPLTIPQIQDRLLEKDQTIVEYFLGNYFVYLFIINKDHFEVFQIELPRDFELWLYQFQDAIRKYAYTSSKSIRKNVDLYRKSAFQLYETLIAPVQPLLKEELIIIPGGALEILPFEAFLTHDAESLGFDFSRFPYLVNQYAISYNFSVNLMEEMLDEYAPKGLKTYMGLAPSFRQDSLNPLGALKHNATEVIRIQSLLGGEYWVGDQATKSNFMEHQSNFKVIHLATHGLANTSISNYSFLAFSSTDNIPFSESLFYVNEVYNLKTQAELIVLSACETGTGEIQIGEGMSSIARSFSYAGAKSIIASKWSVDDLATSNLMYLFFKNLKKGIAKNKALRTAKLAFIKDANPNEAHPYYWASFISIGNMDPISKNRSIWIYFGVIPLLLGLYLVFFWMKVRKMEQRIFISEKIKDA